MRTRKAKNFLSFNVAVLKICILWTKDANYRYDWKRMLKDSTLILSLMPCTISIMADFVAELYGGSDNLTLLVEDLIALNCIFGMIYMVICFAINRKNINKLVKNIVYFRRYGNPETMETVDQRANLFSKLFLFYGIGGNFIYMLMPQLSVSKCEIDQRRGIEKGVDSDTMPCGLVVRSRFPFKFDKSPFFELVFIHQIYTCTVVTIVVLVLTMLLCGLLMHVVYQLSYLRECLRDLRRVPTEKLLDRLVHCIEYHITIIEYSKETVNSFSSMMLLHMTLTSVVISVLCFEILMVPNFEDSLRFSLHLFGWLVLLLLICYYGQLLIDESIRVADEIYNLKWFEMPIDIQKRFHMILLRSQKPLNLSAADMGIMSLPAFLKVLSSAYSFFTLLLKFKT